MVKGEYDFAILVTCLLILALQIHNPFQSQQSSCQYGDGQTVVASSSAQGQARQPSSPTHPGATAGGRRAEPAQPETRRPREAVSPQAKPPGGLSTDDLLRELDSIQVKAKGQQDTLAAAGRMPPASPILEQLRESEQGSNTRGGGAGSPMSGRAVPQQAASYPSAGGQSNYGSAAQQAQPLPLSASAAPGAMGGAVAPSTDAMLRSRSDFGRFLEARQPRGLGVVLGVGRGDFALRLLSDWGSSQGLYLVDPFIHIWRGYDDPANLADRDHQVMFEDLRNRLAPFEGRHVLIRDFSHSFAEAYRGQGQGSPSFVYVDANHAEQAISRDLELWWPLLASGGVLAGSTYTDDSDGRVRVRTSVDRFATANGLKVYLTHDDMPPSWFIFKS